MIKCRSCDSFALNIAPESGYCDVCYYRNKLFNLLAVVHRDGGQYTYLHGVEESVIDALQIITDKVVK